MSTCICIVLILILLVDTSIFAPAQKDYTLRKSLKLYLGSHAQALCFPSALRGISDIPIFMILNSWCVAQRPRPRNHIASGSAGRQKNNSSIGDFYGFSHTHLAAKSLKLHCGNFRFIFTILLSQRVPRVYI